LEKTVSQVSADLGVTTSAIHKAIKEGRLAGRQFSPKLWLIDVDHPLYQQFLEKNEAWREVRKNKQKEK